MSQESMEWKKFENHVADLYRRMGYNVKQNIEILGHQIDCLATYHLPGGLVSNIAIQCKHSAERNIGKNECMDNINALVDLKRNGKADLCVFITNTGFGKELWTTAEANGIFLKKIEDLEIEVTDFSPMIDAIIYDFEHYEEYYQNQRIPIIEIMQKCNLYRHYVPLRCKAQSKVYATVEDYFEKWLEDDSRNHITILGDYGTGKSSLMLSIAYELAKTYKSDPIAQRIPLFISLKDYRHISDMVRLIEDTLSSKYGVSLKGQGQILRMLQSGKFILLLDGFDEMASKSEKEIILKNFEQICVVATGKSKVVLSCRTHYFKTQSHLEEIFYPEGETELMRMVRNSPNFEVVDLLPFDDDQIKSFLSNHTDDWETYWLKIQATYNLEDLAKRPLLLEMIIRSLPEIIKSGEEVNPSELYRIYTDIWIKREDWRSKLSSEEKKSLMIGIATYLYKNKIQKINFEILRILLKQELKQRIISDEDLSIYDNEVRTCTFLNRDKEGNYNFIHRSFMEYFLAVKFNEELRSEKFEYFGSEVITPEIVGFLKFIIEDKLQLNNCIEITKNKSFEDVKYLGGNAISTLNAMGETFNHRDFSSTVLRGGNFEGTSCEASKFVGCDLRNTTFLNHRFSNTLKSP